MHHSHVVKLHQNRQIIETNIRKLEAQLQIPVDIDVEEGDPVCHERHVTLVLLNKARHKRDAIDRALDQTETGHYGLCEDCQTPIDPERLSIFPQTTLCVHCKTLREQDLYRWSA